MFQCQLTFKSVQSSPANVQKAGVRIVLSFTPRTYFPPSSFTFTQVQRQDVFREHCEGTSKWSVVTSRTDVPGLVAMHIHPFVAVASQTYSLFYFRPQQETLLCFSFTNVQKHVTCVDVCALSDSKKTSLLLLFNFCGTSKFVLSLYITGLK